MPTVAGLDGIEVAHGNDCVALMRRHGGRLWAEVLAPDEADQLADQLHSQAAAARAAARDHQGVGEPPPPP